MIGVKWVWAFLDTVESDAESSEAFWHSVTRTQPSERRGERGEFATLVPEGGHAWIKVQRVFTDGGVHLDLDVENLDAAATAATSLGAAEVHRHPEGDVIVLRSPGGVTFCLTSWSRAGSPTTQIRIGEPDLLDQVCLDVPSDLYAAELDFWEHLTGWPRRAGALPEFTSLTRPDGIPVRLLFQRLGEATGTVAGHLDFACVDREASRAGHVVAGAVVISEHEFWTVLRDPVGRTYCLTHRLP